MSVETHRVLLGACGWKHKAWLNTFYSEDLPEEWQLGFYSNEFPVVYVAASDWLDISDSDISNSDVIDLSEWSEDVSDSFRFILEIPANVLSNEQQFTSALNKAKTLAEYCLGLVFQVEEAIYNESVLLQKHIDMAQEFTAVCIDKGDTVLTTDIKNILSEKNVNEVWNGKSEEGADLEYGSLAISHISGDELDMSGLRKAVEVSLSRSNNECVSVLCLDGKPPSLEMLRNAEIILNLL